MQALGGPQTVIEAGEQSPLLLANYWAINT